MTLRKRLLGWLMCCLSLAPAASLAETARFTSPDILVLGDSQLTFGAGPTFLDFFENIRTRCTATPAQLVQLESLGQMRTSVIGVRSSTLQSWLERSGRFKGMVCDVDPNWKVNAKGFGFVSTSPDEFVQIGQGREYQFCEADKSPFETMFRDDYYAPKLLVLSLMGGASDRWANIPDLARQDAVNLVAQIPQDMPCIFMTTLPAHKQEIVEKRSRAQENLKAAFEETNSRCSFVSGLTPETIEAFVGNSAFFRSNGAGVVKDPFHPNETAAKHFFDLEADNICKAIFDQIGTLPQPRG
ncbi:MAG: SGNH/GDSL hydrolase family protein [Pseudomonadota bacterium]